MHSTYQLFQKLGAKSLLLLSAILVTGLIGCTDDDDDNGMGPNDEMNIVEQAQANDDLSILVDAIVEADLQGTLGSDGPFTVFAPSNAAFNKLPDGTVAGLSQEQLIDVLTFHVYDGEILSSDLEATQDVETLQGEELLVTSEGGTVTVNGNSVVTTADLEASNGVIHIVDNVLLPKGIREANIVDQAEELGNFTTLVGALETANLNTTLQYLGPFTVFAPTDDAFSNLPDGLLASLTAEQLTEILQYHVTSGTVLSTDLSAQQAVPSLTEEDLFVTSNGGVNVNGSASVVTADVEATNGVIHAIDQVLLPNKFVTVVGIVTKRYDLSTLAGAVTDAGLVSTLSDPDAEFTVFAPNNAAFEGVDLSGLSQQELQDILTYHVLPSKVLSGDLSDGQTATTVNGEDITVSIDGEGTVSINGDAAIVQTVDLEGTNGVVHIIDGVLTPPSN